MGIPRLTQDIAPYAEVVILGRGESNNSCSNISKLVIDGPSLVYHVYNSLLRISCNEISSKSIEPPSYTDINRVLEHFLDDLTSREVIIQKIIFDGSLPVAKRPTRLERLERTRQDLEQYRKYYNNDNGQRQLPGAMSLHPLSSTDIRKSLWDSTVTTPALSRLLPAPPFMVASAIEYLQSSLWATVTHMVCGEADEHCAFESSQSGSAVLSNDSDLSLYDLGDSGSVIVLRTLELVDHISNPHRSSIRGSCLRPITVARRLDVPNMLAFGYQRSLDPSVSTAIISQRARQHILCQDDEAWIKFREEYRGAKSLSLDHTPNTTCLHCLLRGLDPRNAELICSFNSGEPINMYLSLALEDTARDASWSYGNSIRRLAYSLMLRYNRMTYCEKRGKSVIEYARRGQHISSSQVVPLSPSDMLRMSTDYRHTIAGYLDVHEHRSDSASLPATTNIMYLYYLLAAEFVVTDRVHKCKVYEPALSRVFVCNKFAYLKDGSLSWDEVHLFASMQCVLYSLRILKQIVEYIGRAFPQPQEDKLWNAAQSLHNQIVNMPNINILFPSLGAFQKLLSSHRTGASKSDDICRLLVRLDPANVAQSHQNRSERNPPQRIRPQLEEKVRTFTDAKSPEKRRNESQSHPSDVVKSGRTIRYGKQRNINPFALLDNN